MFLDARRELIFLKDDGSQEPLICEADQKKTMKKQQISFLVKNCLSTTRTYTVFGNIRTQRAPAQHVASGLLCIVPRDNNPGPKSLGFCRAGNCTGNSGLKLLLACSPAVINHCYQHPLAVL